MREGSIALYYENLDTENVVTPVNITRFEQLLRQSGYDEGKSKFLIEGFDGFDLGYRGKEEVKITSPNLKFRGIGNEVILWNKVMKEVKLGRYAGPFEKIPFGNYMQSPIGLVDKDHRRDTRLIFHLSYPRSKQNISVNANTPADMCSVTYPDFCKVIQLCMQAGVGCMIARSDMKSAFRNLGILKSQWKFLVMKAKSPFDGKYYYFFDKCLPFGASISCSHFQKFSDAIAYLIKFMTKKGNVNYLDDFLFVALLQGACNNQVRLFLWICEEINFPVAMEKTFWGTTCLTFLGMLIDTVNQCVSIPMEKVLRAVAMIENVLSKSSKKMTILQLQKICGFLNFLRKCVVPGRAFTRRLYAHTAGNNLKPYHHIKVNSEIRKDLETWLVFLRHPMVFSRPFMDFSKYLVATEINMYTDASGVIGFGGIGGTHWMHQVWPKQFLKICRPSIEYQELFAVVAAVISWMHEYKN